MVQRQVERHDIDSWLAKYAEEAALDILVNDLLHSGLCHAARFPLTCHRDTELEVRHRGFPFLAKLRIGHLFLKWDGPFAGHLPTGHNYFMTLNLGALQRMPINRPT